MEDRCALGSEGVQEVCDPIDGVRLITPLPGRVPDVERALDVDDEQGGGGRLGVHLEGG
jgi:hypothetical protein